MNARQRSFCEHYAACGNAAEAARRAGYSERTARQQGERLLTNADILAYIRQLQDQAASARIADMIEIRQTWTGVLRDDGAKNSDRLKAGELLARAAGEFAGQQKPPVRERSTDGSDAAQDQQQFIARIVLPWNGRSPFNAVETDDGEIVPLSGSESDDVLTFLPYKAGGVYGSE